MASAFSTNELLMGAAYYPEQFGAGEVAATARLMRAAGFNLARMGEFAWVRMEPTAGQFNFGWLEHAVNTLAEQGIRSLLCTPTAAPPKWLTDQYPDSCQVQADGRRREFGKRRHYCPNSASYRRATEQIVAELAHHFRDNPQVIGYQLDNEFMAEEPDCYCDECREKFQARLRAKFGTVAELNRRWNLVFWGQEYGSFAEVVLPKAGHNPSAMQEFRAFTSDSYLEYAQFQAEIIRRISPGKLVTHNICSSGFLYRLDLYRLAAGLDVASVDHYPYAWTIENEHGNAGDQEHHPAMAAFALAITRGLRGAPFWVTEMQTGRTYRPRRGLPEPGLLGAWTHQTLAHGARAVVWFPWQPFPAGTEFLQQAVLEADGQPRRRYREIQAVGRQAQALAVALEGAWPAAAVAMIRDFANDWALADGAVHPDFRSLRHLYRYYRAAFGNHLNLEVVAPEAPWETYRLVLAPSLVMLEAAEAARLRAYVEQGGTLVLTVQSGVRNRDNALWQESLPAGLTELCGLEIEEQHALPGAETVRVVPVEAGSHTGRQEFSQVIDLVKTTTAKTLFTYADGWLAGLPAVTMNRWGMGMVYYVAGVASVEFLTEFIGRVAEQAGVGRNVISASSPWVETVRLTAPGRELLYLINHTREPQTVRVAGEYWDLLAGTAGSGEAELAPFAATCWQRQ